MREQLPTLTKTMSLTMKRFLLLFVFTAVCTSAWVSLQAETEGQPQPSTEVAAVKPPATIDEARDRARLLHELVHGALQVVHRDFFDEENIHAIPSASLEDVFREMSRGYGVEIKWLNVNTDVVNVDHQPETEFDQIAAKGLAKDQSFVEASEAGRYHYAGRIRLASQCLKCHLKHRTSTADRTAGLVISMPLLKANR